MSYTVPAGSVTACDSELAAFVDDLYETNTAAHGAGLAANQVGDPRAIFVYDLIDDARRHRGHVINPVLETSPLPETVPDPDELEGCLSVPGERYPTGRADRGWIVIPSAGDRRSTLNQYAPKSLAQSLFNGDVANALVEFLVIVAVDPVRCSGIHLR
nr:peptide deformylase [Rhodococcus opacus]